MDTGHVGSNVPAGRIFAAALEANQSQLGIRLAVVCGIRSVATSSPVAIRTALVFVDRARAVHGDKYDYSNVDYAGANTKVEIICPTHGIFYQSPAMHHSGNGCQQCYDERRKERGATWANQAAKDFERNGRVVDGRKYDYSKVEYVRSQIPVEIICLIHGSFLQRPASHLQGIGCPECKNDAHRSKTDKQAAQAAKEFIEKAVAVHGDKYEYSKVAYSRSGIRITITCKKHGEFCQTPMKHLAGQGCIKCGEEAARVFQKKRNQKARDEFIARAKHVHQGKYDYSASDYIDARTALVIGCPTHGLFNQTPDSHLAGRGCVKCRDEQNRRLQQEKMQKAGSTFADRSTLIHREKYDYSEVRYKGKESPVTIICPVHGKFDQTPAKHLQGNGCQQCAIELNLGEAEVAKILTSLGVLFERQFAPDWGKSHGQKRYGVIYDFALHDLNILIERDGEQHYFPVRFGGMSSQRAAQMHERQKAADKRKTDLARLHGWVLCRIPYFCEDVAEEVRKIVANQPSYPDMID